MNPSNLYLSTTSSLPYCKSKSTKRVHEPCLGHVVLYILVAAALLCSHLCIDRPTGIRESTRSGHLAKLIVSKYAIASITSTIYNVYLHPLARYPGASHHQLYTEGDCVLTLNKGPPSRAAFHFWDCWSMLGGNGCLDTKKLHDTYGPVVRIMPNALSFNTAQAWKGAAMSE